MMNAAWQRFLESLRGKQVAVCGIGVSNTPLIRLLAQAGARVTACDRRDREKLGACADELEALGVTLHTGEDYLDGLEAEILFRTPGLSYFNPKLIEYRRAGVAVTSEMELFFRFCPAKRIAVTGSDGKTTTTTLIAEFLRAAGKRVFLGGNIGAPLLPQIGEMRPEDYAVVELSSFQLMSMRQSPETAVVTNITPNHLDVHRDMAEYIDAKRNVFLHQDAFSRTVLNLDNETTASFTAQTRGETLLFSRRSAVESGAFAQDGVIYMAYHGQKIPVMRCADIRIPGAHNVENILAALCAVWGEVPVEAVVKTAKEFGGVEHRIEFVRELRGAKWYNDSIASSPTRTIAGLHAFDRRVILLAGGYDKHIPFDVLGPEIAEHVRALILMGATADKIEAAVRACPQWREETTPIIRVENMAAAVAAAEKIAGAGDIVTLSPACASFDAYPNFARRGEHFKSLVAELSE